MKAAFERARQALDFLEHHRLEPSVVHYETALAYVSEPDSDLAREVRARTDDGLRLGAEAMAQLAGRFLQRGREAAVGRRERTVAGQAAELGSLSSDAHGVTSALERDVGTLVADAGTAPPDAGGFVMRLSEAERQLAEVRAEIAKLQTRIGDGDRRQPETERDQLTQALNQSGARRVLEQLANHDRDYAMLMFGVDDLVGINERFGRPVGDNVLNAFAATLEQVFPKQELIRWTGNEFIVVMKDTTLTAAGLLADEALGAMRARRLKLRGSGEWIGIVTASAGMVVGREEGATHVLEQARAKLLSAAAKGGGRIEA